MNGKLFKISTILVSAVILCCCQTADGSRDNEAETRINAFLEQSGRDLAAQNFDAAMQGSLAALETAREADSPLSEVHALISIIGIDIMSSRDADAWEKALEAEETARKRAYKKELAEILIAKAKLCSYAEISPETGRNDEGLEYVREALQLAAEIDAPEQEAEACYVAGSLYINKNRWSDPIDPQIYRAADEYLSRGQAIADSCGPPRLKRNGIMFRSRWLQQGNDNQKAIQYFEQALQSLNPEDYLTASALDDRLVRLYTRSGDAQKALDTHDDYVYRMQKYMQQKNDETLQEMETRFKVQEKERMLQLRHYQILVLLLVLALAVAAVLLIVGHLRKVRRRNAELQRINDSKEQIIEFLSRDLRNPASAIAGQIAQLSTSAASLPPEKIREKCSKLASEAEAINTDVANYVGDILIERSRRISDLGLTKRELEIIRLSAEGLKASEIAERTYLSVHTINTHRQRIYSKMDVNNVSEMLHKATELGII